MFALRLPDASSEHVNITRSGVLSLSNASSEHGNIARSGVLCLSDASSEHGNIARSCVLCLPDASSDRQVWLRDASHELETQEYSSDMLMLMLCWTRVGAALRLPFLRIERSSTCVGKTL